MGELADRRSYARSRTEEFKARLGTAAQIADGRACVYATGSFGRLEASQFSDFDLCIVGRSDGEGNNLLSPLDEICLKAELISAIRTLRLPEFDGDGKYLVHYPVKNLIDSIGSSEDDASNALTSRLLLLLESQPLLGKDIHKEAVESIIASYWRDYEDHKEDFIPAFLANDVLRLWRTFCVNYEARTRSQPEEKKAKRKIKNFKLKHSRILTCFSGLLYLLATYSKNKTVSPNDAVDMSSLTPTERLQGLLGNRDVKEAHSSINRLLEQYERFLGMVNESEEDLVRKVLERSIGKEFFGASYEFGETMFEAIEAVGKRNKFHRLLVV